jgi:hypothetical protein
MALLSLSLRAAGDVSFAASRPPVRSARQGDTEPLVVHSLVGPFRTSTDYFCAVEPGSCVGSGDAWAALERVNEHVLILTSEGWFVDPEPGSPRSTMFSRLATDGGFAAVELFTGYCDPPDGCFEEDLVSIVVCDLRRREPRCSRRTPLSGVRARDDGKPFPIKRIGETVQILGVASARSDSRDRIRD